MSHMTLRRCVCVCVCVRACVRACVRVCVHARLINSHVQLNFTIMDIQLILCSIYVC